MVRRTGQIKLMNVFGIRIVVDAGWFLMLFLVIIWLSPSFRGTLHSSESVAYVITVITALLFFGSLIVHELGHALVARRQGIEVRGIQLFLLGGFAQLSRDAVTPGEEFKISAAGPAATLGMLALFLAVDLAIVGPHLLWHAIILDDQVKVTPVLLALSWLLPMNVIVLVFNLVPAFPLDGGRIARAAVWHFTGDKQRGTKVAAQMGQGFAVLLGALGLWLLLGVGGLSGLWLLLVAFLLGQSARGALVQSELSDKIAGVRVSDIMDRQPVAIPAQTAVGEALETFFLRYGWPWFPVTDESGHFLGLARQERLQATADGGEGWLTVGSVLESEEAGKWFVGEDRPLSDVLASEGLRRLGAVMAVDGEGILRGVVTIEQVRRALQAAVGSPAA